MAVKLGVSFGAEVTVLSTSPSKKADAISLGAHDFVVTTDTADAARAANRFDFILDTLSAVHDYNTYLAMLKTEGTLVCLGLPPEPIQVPPAALVFTGRCVAGSLIGGLPQTQEMLNYCGEHDIMADVEVIPMDRINEAYERMLRSDVKYRFVIDLASLR